VPLVHRTRMGAQGDRVVADVQLANPLTVQLFFRRKEEQSYHRKYGIRQPSAQPRWQGAAVTQRDAKRGENPIAKADKHGQTEADGHATAHLSLERERNCD
jgi:hypothetical protein